MNNETKQGEPRFSVAEVTKNWSKETPVNNLISQQFELVINTNAARGYKLIDWKLIALVNGEVLTETIIAIFEINNTQLSNNGK